MPDLAAGCFSLQRNLGLRPISPRQSVRRRSTTSLHIANSSALGRKPGILGSMNCLRNNWSDAMEVSTPISSSVNCKVSFFMADFIVARRNRLPRACFISPCRRLRYPAAPGVRGPAASCRTAVPDLLKILDLAPARDCSRSGMSIRTLIALFLILAASLAAQTTTTSSTRQFTFPPVGLGSTETAEINVVNAASNSSTGTAASCTGNLSFLNASGATIGAATPFTLAAGQSSFARVPFASAANGGTRTLIRAVVEVTGSTATPRPPCSLDFSFQTFDTTTGASHVLVTSPATSYGAGPQGGGQGGH